MEHEPMSPYAEALQWVLLHPGTSSSIGLAKLLLSLWNDKCGFSYRLCIASLDSKLTALALRVIQHFHQVGEDKELIRVGYAVCDRYPHLWDLAMVAEKAQQEFIEKERAAAHADDENDDTLVIRV
jgi:hypothetical protein